MSQLGMEVRLLAAMSYNVSHEHLAQLSPAQVAVFCAVKESKSELDRKGTTVFVR